MTVVVTDNCRGCRFTECVTVCPTECFHADEQMVYIAPDDCVECHACIGVCPVRAIFDTDDLPDHLAHWLAVNRERAATLPVLTEKIASLPNAEARRTALGF